MTIHLSFRRPWSRANRLFRRSVEKKIVRCFTALHTFSHTFYPHTSCMYGTATDLLYFMAGVIPTTCTFKISTMVSSTSRYLGPFLCKIDWANSCDPGDCWVAWVWLFTQERERGNMHDSGRLAGCRSVNQFSAARKQKQLRASCIFYHTNDHARPRILSRGSLHLPMHVAWILNFCATCRPAWVGVVGYM